MVFFKISECLVLSIDEQQFQTANQDRPLRKDETHC